MVCKEDVLLWFKDLEGYKRIDVMYELLNMCVPFEVRFLGSCIEEIGKHSYQELRGSMITANDLDKLAKDTSLMQGLGDEGVRHRVLIYLSLLSSRNCKCANWFYKTLLRTEWVESCVLKGNCKDENLQSELLLLFTLGLHHPAFTFDQKTFFGNMLAHVIEQRELKKHIASKPFPGYPPGFGYSNVQKISAYPDTPIIPVKSASLLHGEPPGPHQQHPQGVLGHPVGAPLDLMHMWNRPGFAGPISGAPEANHIPDDKLREAPWLNSVMLRVDMKPPNGMRFPSFNKVPQQYFIDQMQALNLEGENSLHFSSSSSSSNNSLNQSPPDTPTTTPAVPHHAPGRGDSKSRLNGVPQFASPPASISAGPPMCDTTPPPPPVASVLSNCSVPYTNYPPQVTLTAVPNRSVFHYSQAYRPPFSSPFNYQPPEVYTYSCPYIPFVFSSTPSQAPPRNPNCYNCGATGHNGAECNGQTIEEITQKKNYTLEYNSTVSEPDK